MNSVEELLSRPGGLGDRLRDLRLSAQLTGVVMAARLGWTQSKISKIETGRQAPSREDIDRWVDVCGAGVDIRRELLDLLAQVQAVHREWRQQVRRGQVAIQQNYDGLGRAASVVRNAEVVFIPGLLQTAEYACCRIAEAARLHGGGEDDVDAATLVRMRRQEVLYDPSKRFEFVTTEAALRLLLCPPSVMRAQLDRLLAVMGMPNLTLGIIPFGIQLETAPQNCFILFDDLAVVETMTGETTHVGDEAAAYATAMDALLAEAWTGHRARRLIAAAIRHLPATEL